MDGQEDDMGDKKEEEERDEKDIPWLALGRLLLLV